MLRSAWLLTFCLTAIISLLAIGFCIHTQRSFWKHLRAEAAKMDPGIPENRQFQAAIESGVLEDVGIEVPSGMMWRLSLADLIQHRWDILLPMVVLVSYGFARWCTR